MTLLVKLQSDSKIQGMKLQEQADTTTVMRSIDELSADLKKLSWEIEQMQEKVASLKKSGK